MTDDKDIIYCSGPLFCPEEIAGMTAIANVLETAGFATFVPHRDGLEFYLMRHVNTPLANLPGPKTMLSRLVFALDVYQVVERCDALVMNFNGRVPDEGAVAEAGIAFAAGTPLIIYKNDDRTVFNGADNGMVSCLSYAPLVPNINKIPEVLRAVMDAAPSDGRPPRRGESMAPVLRDTVDLGRKVWRTMKTLRLDGGDPREDSELIRELVTACADHPSLGASPLG